MLLLLNGYITERFKYFRGLYFTMASDNTESLRGLLQAMKIEDKFNYEGLGYDDVSKPHSLLGFECKSPPNEVGARLAYMTFVSVRTHRLFEEAHPDNRGVVQKIKDLFSGSNVQGGLKDIVDGEKILKYNFGIEFPDSSITVIYGAVGSIYEVNSSIPQKDFDQWFEDMKQEIDSFAFPATIIMKMYKENYVPANTQQQS